MTDPNATPVLPATPPPTGTIDITDLVAKLKESWIRWACLLIEATTKTVPALMWLSWPVISFIFNFAVERVVTVIANAVEMQSFFLNTAVKKASQAHDYVDAVNAKNALPPTVTDDDYEKAEKAEMVLFRNFVLLST